MRGSLRYTTVESIDEAIAELERKQLHESLSLAEEKQVIESIRSLNKSRSAVAELSSKLLTLESDDGARAAIATSLKELDGKLDAAKASRDALRAEQDAAWKAERAKGEDYPALRAEEDALRAENKAVYEQIKGKREALDAAWAQYKSDMTLFRQQIEADRKRRDEEFAARRAEREAARLARIRENAPEPFCHELGIAENLVSHLEKAIAGADKGAAQAAAARQRAEAAQAAKVAAAEAAKSSGLAPLVKTQLEGIQIGAAKGGKKNKRNAKKKSQSPAEAATAEPAAAAEAAAPAKAAAAETSSAPAAASASASPSDRLTHSLDLLEAFAALGVSVPLRASDAPAALEAVKKEQARYLALKAQAQAEPDNEEVQALARESAAKTYKALGVAPPKELLQGDKAEESKEQDKEGDGKKTNGADADAEPSSAAAAAAAKPSSSAAAAKPSSSSASKKGGKKGASKPPPALSNATVWPTFGGLGDDEAEAARPAFAEAFAGKSLAQAAAEPPKPKPAQQEEEEQEQEEGEEQPAEEVFVEEVVVEEALEA